jgi:hypothetical protein
LKHFIRIPVFYGDGLLAPRPIPKLEDHPLSAVRNCLSNIFTATLRNQRTFLHLQPEDMPCHGDKGPTQHGKKILSPEWVLRAVSLGVKQLGCAAHHSLPSSVKVCGATPPLPHAFRVWCLVKPGYIFRMVLTPHRNNFTLCGGFPGMADQ